MDAENRNYYSNSSNEGKPKWIITPNSRKGAKEQVEELLMKRLLSALEFILKYKSK